MQPSMAKISKPPIPTKLYKHFAAVTIALTAAIAMFADEDHQAAAVRAAERQAPTPAARNTPAYGEAKLTRAEDHSAGSFGSEASGDYGQPMLTPANSGATSRAYAPQPSNRQPLPNMTAEEVAALSQEEYDRLRALYAAAGAIENIDRSAQMSEIEAASARRAGHRASDS